MASNRIGMRETLVHRGCGSDPWFHRRKERPRGRKRKTKKNKKTLACQGDSVKFKARSFKNGLDGAASGNDKKAKILKKIVAMLGLSAKVWATFFARRK